MTGERILVTGGAGFIGSHLVDRLVGRGAAVRVLDSLEPQVHGESDVYRNPAAEYVIGSVLDGDVVKESLVGVTSVVHLAAQVGVGQSMYEMTRYVAENTLGAAVLLEAAAECADQLNALVVASSMSIYGEGSYSCLSCEATGVEVSRPTDRLTSGKWEPVCSRCGADAVAAPTPESKPLECGSVYAVTKRDHEELALVFGRAHDVRTVALRFFNVYGTRQSLSNPYTGVAAIFSSRLLNNAAPLIFEDGLQSRDFVHVSDIVRAIDLSLTTESARDVAINIGTGRATSVLRIAELLSAELGVDIQPEILGRFRHGDIRHCFADISRAQQVLGYRPEVELTDGMRELVAWIQAENPAAKDQVEAATAELSQRGLIV